MGWDMGRKGLEKPEISVKRGVSELFGLDSARVACSFLVMAKMVLATGPKVAGFTKRVQGLAVTFSRSRLAI